MPEVGDSERRACPECGAQFDASESTRDTEVIDVEAQPVGQGGRVEDEYADYEGHAVVDPRDSGWEEGRRRIFRFEQREVGGGGCCNCGCILIVLLLLLALQGLFSLFT